MHLCVCDGVTLLSSRKRTEHCKPAMMEKIKIIEKCIFTLFFFFFHPSFDLNMGL